MKNLHIPTILVTLGLVGLVAILSGQNMVGSPRVTVNNPLGVPGWVPSDVWVARYGKDSTGSFAYEDYTVPAGHFALVRSMTGRYEIELQIDDGSGFVIVTSAKPGKIELGSGGGSSSASLDPGIVVDEGSVIRAGASEGSVHGYLIPK